MELFDFTIESEQGKRREDGDNTINIHLLIKQANSLCGTNMLGECEYLELDTATSNLLNNRKALKCSFFVSSPIFTIASLIQANNCNLTQLTAQEIS